MEKFSLKWNDFQSNVSRTFIDLRRQSSLIDVTLVGSDQKQVRAHRLVLSACSDFFKNIFDNINTQSNLVLYLDGVSSDELSLILDYVYQGEVQIYQDKLDRFLEISEKYQVDGLNVNDSENHEFTTESLHQELEESTDLNNSPIDEKEFPTYGSESSVATFNISNERFSANNSEVDEKYQELVVKDNDVLRCTVCGRTNKYRCNMRRHIETHLSGLSYECIVCKKAFRSSQALGSHNLRWHGGWNK